VKKKKSIIESKEKKEIGKDNAKEKVIVPNKFRLEKVKKYRPKKPQNKVEEEEYLP